MPRTPRILTISTIVVLWSACQNSRPIVTVDDDAGGGPGGTGVAGAGGSTAGTSDHPMGGGGGAAIPCDGGAVIVCADATKVCSLADCPGGGGGTSGAGGGAAGTGQVGVGTLVACPASPPSGTCSIEFMNCEYPDQSCRCTGGSWSCTACPATPQATSQGALCRNGNLTCSEWGCGVCPDAHPTEGAACGNSMFKCQYGGDVCLCGGNVDGWRCATLSCPPSPSSDGRPSCASFSLADGTGIGFDHACVYAAENQACACNDGRGYNTFKCNCPAAAPAEGSACIGPSPCSYGGVTCNCSAGHWRCGGACPASKPAAGTACSSLVSCSYGKDAGTDFCACDGATWSCF
jgi:hypothetical protein